MAGKLAGLGTPEHEAGMLTIPQYPCPEQRASFINTGQLIWIRLAFNIGLDIFLMSSLWKVSSNKYQHGKDYGEVKLSLCLISLALRHKDVWGSGCMDPCILDLGSSRRWVVSFTPPPLYPEKGAPGTNWIGGWVGPRIVLDDAERREILPLPGLKFGPLVLPARSQSLYRLSYPGSGKGYYNILFLAYFPHFEKTE
jgi:hypothetical protein